MGIKSLIEELRSTLLEVGGRSVKVGGRTVTRLKDSSWGPDQPVSRTLLEPPTTPPGHSSRIKPQTEIPPEKITRVDSPGYKPPKRKKKA